MFDRMGFESGEFLSFELAPQPSPPHFKHYIASAAV
jgi:hypothetical protein